jgi:hypothetical protein
VKQGGVGRKGRRKQARQRVGMGFTCRRCSLLKRVLCNGC